MKFCKVVFYILQCIDEPAESWFWPECKLAVNNEQDDEEDDTSTSNEEENDHKNAAEEEEYEEDKDFSVCSIFFNLFKTICFFSLNQHSK